MSDTLITAETPPAADTTPKVETPAVDAAPKVDPPAETKPADAPKVETPIVYDFKAPEGMELDKGQLDEFKAIAAEHKLPAEAAQKLVDIAIKAEGARADAHKATVAGWAESVKADKELGGDKLPETIATAKKAMALGTPEFQTLIKDSGLGNHPEVVRFMHTVGKTLSEDRFVNGTTTPAEPKSLADRLYPNHK